MRVSRLLSLVSIACASTLVACGGGGDAPGDAGTDATTPPPDGGGGGDHDAGGHAHDAGVDGGGGCARVAAGNWETDGPTDVDVEYRAPLTPAVGLRNELSILFERRGLPEIGTWELGEGGADANFGDCTHCVFIGLAPDHAYFADRGTLVVREDPYSRRLDVSLSGARLIEVAVDPLTRASTPIDDGECVEVADLDVTALFAPAEWTCGDSAYGDGETCDCTCGAYDPDCDGPIECFPDDPGCTPRDALPVADCDAASEICSFDVEIGTTRCTETCDWRTHDPCLAGTCVPSIGVDPVDTCFVSGLRLDDARIGEDCDFDGFQRFCEVVGGFANGYCDPANVCRPVCSSDSECTIGGESCQLFRTIPGSLGYCGPPPVFE